MLKADGSLAKSLPESLEAWADYQRRLAAPASDPAYNPRVASIAKECIAPAVYDPLMCPLDATQPHDSTCTCAPPTDANFTLPEVVAAVARAPRGKACGPSRDMRCSKQGAGFWLSSSQALQLRERVRASTVRMDEGQRGQLTQGWRRLRPQQLPWNITYQLPGQDLPLYLGRALSAPHGIATYSVASGTRSRSITLTAAPP